MVVIMPFFTHTFRLLISFMVQLTINEFMNEFYLRSIILTSEQCLPSPFEPGSCRLKSRLKLCEADCYTTQIIRSSVYIINYLYYKQIFPCLKTYYTSRILINCIKYFSGYIFWLQ